MSKMMKVMGGLGGAALLLGACATGPAMMAPPPASESASFCPPSPDCPVEYEGYVLSAQQGARVLTRLGRPWMVCPNDANCPTGVAGYYMGRLFAAPASMRVCRQGSAAPCPTNMRGNISFSCPKTDAACLAALRTAFGKPESGVSARQPG